MPSASERATTQPDTMIEFRMLLAEGLALEDGDVVREVEPLGQVGYREQGAPGPEGRDDRVIEREEREDGDDDHEKPEADAGQNPHRGSSPSRTRPAASVMTTSSAMMRKISVEAADPKPTSWKSTSCWRA